MAAWLRSLFENHAEALCAYLKRKYGAGPPDPEDAVQQAFLLMSKLTDAQIRGVSHPKAFLFRVGENALLGEKRKLKTRNLHATEVVRQSASERFDTDPESVLVSKEELDLVEGALRDMPERWRRAFLMHRMDDMSFADIGRALGVSPTAARNYVERALGAIEAAMDEADKANRETPQ